MNSTDAKRAQDALRQAIDIVGQAQLAAHLGIKYQAVQGWFRPGRKYVTPPRLCPAIERLTEGAVRCEDLCPAVEWGVLRESPPAKGDVVPTTREWPATQLRPAGDD